MKTLLVMVALASAAAAGAQSAHEVRGYTRSDGTYVAPHYQSNADTTKLNNYSTQGNVNPYTGQTGHVDPYRPTPANPYGSPYNASNGVNPN